MSPKPKGKAAWAVILVAVLAILAIAAFVLWGNSGSRQTAPFQEEAQSVAESGRESSKSAAIELPEV